MENLLIKIISHDHLHAKWLNTLSYLENCGARKIAKCQHPTLVKEELLKHASEEFRHAHYLKKQIKKVSKNYFKDYSQSNIMGGYRTLHYIHHLDIFVSRYLLDEISLNKGDIPLIAYLFVTYAIEVRAKSLYNLYDKCLKKLNSSVYVKSIILEEEDHLNEMEKSISFLPYGQKVIEKILIFENQLFNLWILKIKKEINITF